MAIPKVCGVETEYGILVRNADPNPVLASSVLINSYIAPYREAKTWGHEERRLRKLLVSKKELSKLWNATAREGMTIVPMKWYFNDRGLVKVKLGVAKGKKLSDKRETVAKRDWDRQKQRLLKAH